MPFSVIWNTPSSFTEPKRFFTARKRRYSCCRSPSKYSTTSTMCSSIRGPAMAPSLVTCPTRKIAVPLSLARRMSRLVHSRIWLTLPGAEAISGRYMVWMESITATSGCSWLSFSSTPSRAFSASTYRLGTSTPSRLARSLSCLADSSPLTYKTRLPLPHRLAHTCKSSVDLPIPGSPPMSISPPSTMPPPSTRSSSPMPVDMRTVTSSGMSLSSMATAPVPGRCLGGFTAPAADDGAGEASSRVFQAPQPGHRPAQREVS